MGDASNTLWDGIYFTTAVKLVCFFIKKTKTCILLSSILYCIFFYIFYMCCSLSWLLGWWVVTQLLRQRVSSSSKRKLKRDFQFRGFRHFLRKKWFGLRSFFRDSVDTYFDSAFPCKIQKCVFASLSSAAQYIEVNPSHSETKTKEPQLVRQHTRS